MTRRWQPTDEPGTRALNQPNQTGGIILFLSGVALMTAMDVTVKWLVTDDLHVVQLLFVRSIIIVAILLMFYLSRRKLSQLKPQRTTAQCIRGLIGFIAPFAFFTALKYLSLTAATVVFFSNIFFITFLSALLLKERVGLYRWSAVFIGYIGVVIAIDPQAEGELFGYMMTLLSSATFAYLFISGKMLGNTETSESLVLFYNLGVGMVAMVLMPLFWQPLSITDIAGLLLLSSLAVVGQYCMTHAFAIADASLLAPLNYSALAMMVVFDWLIWQTIPGSHTVLGAVIVVLSGCIVIWRQQRTARMDKATG